MTHAVLVSLPVSSMMFITIPGGFMSRIPYLSVAKLCHSARAWAWVGAAIVLGCSSDTDPSDDGKATGALCPTNSMLTYASFGQAFMQSYCLRCHSESVKGADRKRAPSDHNFDLPLDVRLLADHIDRYAGAGPEATNTIMPPNGPLPSEAERRQLSEWLACGAP